MSALRGKAKMFIFKPYRKREGLNMASMSLIGLCRVAASAALLIAAAGSCLSPAAAANLRPIDPAALQAVVDALGRELMLPGAMILLRTPDGAFAYGYGATELGGTTAPAGDTHFRIAYAASDATIERGIEVLRKLA